MVSDIQFSPLGVVLLAELAQIRICVEQLRAAHGLPGNKASDRAFNIQTDSLIAGPEDRGTPIARGSEEKVLIANGKLQDVDESSSSRLQRIQHDDVRDEPKLEDVNPAGIIVGKHQRKGRRKNAIDDLFSSLG